MATKTPWGLSQDKKQICRGIMLYTTATHGGLHISKKLNMHIPEYMRNETQWYEEDCDWAIPIVVLFNICTGIENPTYQRAVAILKNWYWKEYEQFFNVVLLKGESFKKDIDIFYVDNVNQT